MCMYTYVPITKAALVIIAAEQDCVDDRSTISEGALEHGDLADEDFLGAGVASAHHRLDGLRCTEHVKRRPVRNDDDLFDDGVRCLVRRTQSPRVATRGDMQREEHTAAVAGTTVSLRISARMHRTHHRLHVALDALQHPPECALAEHRVISLCVRHNPAAQAHSIPWQWQRDTCMTLRFTRGPTALLL